MNQCPYDYKVRLPHEPEIKLCTTCKRRLPITAFRYRVKYFSGVAKWWRYAQCHECNLMKRRQRVMRQQKIKNAEKLIHECLDFNILQSRDGKVRVFFIPEGKTEEEGNWVLMPISEAAKDIVKQNAFDVLEKALEEKKKIFVDHETFRTDTEVYADLMRQAKEHCFDHFPALHDTVFGEADNLFLFYDGDFFTLYYFNPDANCGGSLVECTFDDEMAKRILDGEDLMTVLAERDEYLYDIDTISFFKVLNNLSTSLFDEQFIGYASDEDGLLTLIEQTLKIKKIIQRK